MTISRKAYLEATGDRYLAHRAYYAQFVTRGHLEGVRRRIGLETLRASDDQRHFNDVPLARWDALAQTPLPARIAEKMRALGDYPTLAGHLCIHKEAARQLIERTGR